MILEFAEHQYIDVDQISAIRQLNTPAKNGVVFVNGQKMSVNMEEFEVIEKAYLYLHKSHMYNSDMTKRGKR